MKTACFIILTLLLFNGCAEQKPRHKIYGTWESFKNPRMTLEFRTDNSLKSQMIGENNVVYKKDYHYRTSGDDAAEFFDDSTGARAIIGVKVESENSRLRLECALGRHADGKAMIDPPNLCLYKEFRKAGE